jgi:carbon starvation protein
VTNVIEVAVTVFIIYAIAYIYYGRNLLERRVVKADPTRKTPAIEKFDGVDYVPANKYVLYGHHFASIAGAGPIVGPAIAMSYGWFLPLIWVLFGNVFIGAVHDYLALMASVRYGGLSIMSISENVMGRKAKYVFLVYVYGALILVLAAFLSVAASLYTKIGGAATKAIIFMPLALLLGIMVYRANIDLKLSSIITLILVAVGFYYAYKVPLLVGFHPTKSIDPNAIQAYAHYLNQTQGIPLDKAMAKASLEAQKLVYVPTYHFWTVVLAIYSFIAASLPVWYLLQPRDYLNAYLLWTFVAIAGISSLVVFNEPLRLPAYIQFSPPIFQKQPTPFWPAIPLIIACGALSGFHSVVASGTSSKQLSNEMDALLVGYGGMLTEGAVSSLAVILPVSIAHQAPQLGGANFNILGLSPVSRFVVGYGYMSGLAATKLHLSGSFETAFSVMKLFAAIALATFILTTLDTATRLGRFAWQEMFDWLEERSPTAYRVIANRWVATGIAVLIGAGLAYPTVTIGNTIYGAYRVVWPAFAGVNQLLAALALLTSALWVYAILKVRGGTAWLIIVPALFLWITVTVGLGWWLVAILPHVPAVQQIGSGSIVVISLILDLILIALFAAGLKRAAKQQ